MSNSQDLREKYEELYKYSKSVLDEEMIRLRRAGDNAKTLVHILISLLAVFGVLAATNDFHGLLKYQKCSLITLFLAGFVLLGFVVSFFLAFYASRFDSVKNLDFNDRVIHAFTGNDLARIYYSLSVACQDCLEENRKRTDLITLRLRRSYKAIYGTVLIFILFLLYIILDNQDRNFVHFLGEIFPLFKEGC
uniref:Transmembrane protein n=1 Tax=Candidatus Kentrum sp. FW TaxID=2126338 RepID=A0A450TT72_9GAMM|nr:MAG: hypothetical protein BECKFW1821C_GA0114237_10299 [Candidatus Kentron sp. FW]